MDNILNIDNMDMIRTLGLLHDGIEILHETVVTYVEDGKRYIVNLNDEPLIVEDENKILIRGTFVIVSDKIMRTYLKSDITVYNTITLKRKEFRGIYFDIDNLVPLGTHFIGIKQFDKQYNAIMTMYNINMEEVYKLVGARVVKCLEDTPVSTRIGRLVGGTWRMVIANKATNDIDIYDSYTLDDDLNLELVGKEWDREEELSIHRQNIPNIRYQLSCNYKGVGKSYMDITRPAELSNTPYVMTHDFDCEYKKGRICKGIMKYEDGTEIFKTLYDNITYVGADNFILDFFETRQIVSAKTGIIIDSVPKNQIGMHQTLPVVVIVIPGKCLLLDTKGRLFNSSDISKYFDCYYSADDSEIIKVKLEYKDVFVTNRLIPITNMHSIAHLYSCEWVKM